ncbi:sulfhydryl oxidase 2-like isoform X1 [Silene latifolia]|uniref:sulfhydryl oxidase 2-like isoform X1 n=1 Tax=Silene latifolia TaxID=37657 RepID=UPI003D78A71C
MSPIFRLLVLLLFGTIIEASSSSSSSYSTIGSRSLLRKLDDGGNGADLPDVVVELNDSNFKDVLKETPAPIAIVEFFAHWCPACRNYKPHYEKVARIFNGPNASHPGLIFMARVDCASKINTKLCDRFSVDRYPMLFWGRPSNFTSINKWDGKDGEIVSIKNGHTAERLLEWINKKMNSSYGFEDKKYEHEHLQSKAFDLEQITQAIYDVEEATTLAFDIILRHKMIKQGTKGSLLRFLQLMVAHHPSRRCRKGSAEILVNFDDLYPLEFESEIQERGLSENATSILGTIQICGKDVPRGYWMFCRGSNNDTRGFSCGLWILLHSLSVRIEDGESHVAFTATCDFIHNFFICEECRQHFFDMCSRVSIPFNRTQDFALWLWDAHNSVNERLLKEEVTLGTADPKYPKTIWPPEQLCPACYLSSPAKEVTNHIKWNKDEVFKFLVRYYGIKLPSLYKNKGLLREESSQHSHSEEPVATSNPVVVPIGAALAIAVASCAFGALACVWRSRQKSRKPRRSWN